MTRRHILAVAVLGLVVLAGCHDDATEPEPQDNTVTQTFTSAQFIGYRFFHLDRPELESAGRTAQERIDPNSIRIFQAVPEILPGPLDVAYAAAYGDTAGCHAWESGMDFRSPFAVALTWRPLDFTLIDDPAGEPDAIDLGHAAADNACLAVSYRVVDGTGAVTAQVGDDPSQGPPTQAIAGQTELYYRLKLLKAPANIAEPSTCLLEMRNIYPLGGMNLDVSRFDLRIESRQDLGDPQTDESGVPYVGIFGLDRRDLMGAPVPDGIPDYDDPRIFDFARGLLTFPEPHEQPFAADSTWYAGNVGAPYWTYGSSIYLTGHQAPELYDPSTPRSELSYYG